MCTNVHLSWNEPYHITKEELFLLKKEAQCAICDDLSDIEKDFSILTCGHVFHMGCINKWFQNEKPQNY